MATPHAARLAPRFLLAAGLAVACAVALPSARRAGDPLRVPAPGERPPDRRLGTLRTLDSHCPFTPPATREAWDARAARIRRQVRVALGLWPWPTRTPLNAVVTGTVARDGYTVERVALESVPGHFVTGSLYKPTGKSGRLPAVLSPHGHWPGGRFQDVEDDEVAKQLGSRAESIRAAAHHVLQARAVHLSRLGAIAFLIDLEGYADSQQLGEALVHHFTAPRPGMHGANAWGFFSPQAELRLQSMLGLVAWNAERALDYLAGRPDVDPGRIGVTGASGGGTQTFLLGTIDERPKALFPAVMVSTHMQGGCTCENASYLRIGTGNAEIAATIAPRPLGMTAADDWTKEFERDGYPEVRAVYELFGASDQVKLDAFLQFPHNYNAPARAAMYEWFNTHLGLGWSPVPAEREFVPLSRDEASVWDAAHPAPRGGPDHERALLAAMARDAESRVASLVPRDAAGWARYREVVGGAWEVILGGAWPPGDAASFTERSRAATGLGSAALGYVVRASNGASIPAARFAARGPARGVAVWVDPGGKQRALSAEGRPQVEALMDAGYDVLAIDAFELGDYRAADDPLVTVRMASDRAHAGYTFGYNLPVPAQRAQDVLAAVQAARALTGAQGRVVLVARGAATGWAAGARFLAGGLVSRTALDAGEFQFADADRIDSPELLPGAVRYGDIDALAALGEGDLLVAGRAEPTSLVTAVRRARGLAPARSSAAPLTAASMAWLVQ
jgi:dienelactone hydrolase